MPELPEVETVCRGLIPHVEGQRLKKVLQRRADLRIPFPPDFSSRLTNQRVERITRRAKYMRWHLESGEVLLIHLGMSGRMTILDADPGEYGKHDHVVFVTEAGVTVLYNDVRRFGMMDICSEEALDQHRFFADLGPEPLGNQFNADILQKAFEGRKSNIKNTLLDQHVVVGLGNIYVCEALFRSGVSPKRTADSCTGQQAEALVPIIRDVLSDAIAAGGSSLKDYRQADGELGYFQHSFQVYGREGEPCVTCDTPIARIVQSNRSTFYCPNCQR